MAATIKRFFAIHDVLLAQCCRESGSATPVLGDPVKAYPGSKGG
jgi:hypothetical protein